MTLYRLLTLMAASATLTVASTWAGAQSGGTVVSNSAPLAATAPTPVPALISYSGIAIAGDGKPLSGDVPATFLLFKEQQGGEPLFAETQTVTSNAGGHYKVQLGATLSNGLPADLFSTGEARWLEVQFAGAPPQPRALLVSVPYALKAADATTLGGLPASAFALAGTRVSADAVTATAGSNTAADVTTTDGVSGYLPEFSGATSVVDSPVFVSGANIGIGTTSPTAMLDVNGSALVSGALTANGGETVGGMLEMAPTGTATAAGSKNSQMVKFYTSAYNSTSKAVVNPRFEWEAEATGNNTAAPSATLNLLSSTTAAGATETGFHFNANGTMKFAAGQTFPGTGSGTITGVTAGTGLTGGGAAGNVALSVNKSVVAFQSDLTNAEKTLNTSIAAAQTNAVGTSEGYTNSNFLPLGGGAINGSVSIQGSAQGASNVFSVTGASPQDLELPGQGIALTSGNGGTGAFSISPASNGGSIALTAGSGGYAYLQKGGDGGQIVLRAGQPGGGLFSGARGQILVEGDDDGVLRTAPAQIQIQGISNPNKQLLIGYLADAGSDNGYGSIQATVDGTVNTPLLLNPNGGGVGIQTTNVTNSLTIGQGQGGAVADAWYTYSSRRFKTDIKTLPDALDKVEKLRGVSYTLKATGKHEIGVIAEEVGAVVPEVVTYEKNGVDAQSVDYARLTALLIEAVKQQQAEIERQNDTAKKQQALIDAQASGLAAALKTIKSQQALLRKQSASLSSLKTELRATNQSLRQVHQELGSTQTVLVSSR